MKVLKRVLPYAARQPFGAGATFLAAVLSAVLVVVFPVTAGRIVDIVISQNKPSELLPLIAIGFAGFLGQHGAEALRALLSNHFEQRIVCHLRSDLYTHIQQLPLSWFDKRSTGDLMTRLIEDTTSIERMLVETLEQGLVAAIQLAAVISLMAFYSPALTLAVLAPIPFLAAGALAYGRIAHRYSRRYRAAFSAMNSLIHDNLSGIRQIKTFATEETERRRFGEASSTLSKAMLKEADSWAVYHPLMGLIASCGLLLVAGLGASQVMNGSLAVGGLVTFLVLTNYLYAPINKLHHLNHIFQSGRTAGERIFEILDTSAESDEALNAPRRPIHGLVRYQNVSFSFDGQRKVLDRINLEVCRGQMLALVGPTGAGKSTIVNLLVRFYELAAGDIDIDGVSIREIPKRHLREHIAVVTQENFIFSGTTAENLRVAKRDAKDDELWEALRVANADIFVRSLPDGLHTHLGERGVRLSVGERQRISIARALLKNPPILILDEATASVDTHTEALIQQALERLMADRTSLVIAHRLSTVRNANEIIVIDKGRIIERGKHAELVEEGGLYTTLFRHSLI